MRAVPTLPPDLASRTEFLAWGPPEYTMRSRLLAQQLGIEVRHIHSTRRRGMLAAPVKYGYQAVATVAWLARRRPRLVFVQNPPSLAVLFVWMYSLLTGAGYVVDAHSDAFMSRYWSRPRWLHGVLARRALTTIVTNEHFAGIVRGWRGRAAVIRNIPGRFEHRPVDLGVDFNIAVVSTFAPDEPIDAVVRAASSVPDTRFRITGDPERGNGEVPTEIPGNVELTGYLPAEEYYGLLHDSDATLVLTTRDHTMQRGACEALSLGTPIITSDWPILVDYFRKGTVHIDNTASGIERGIIEMRRDHERYRQEICELRQEVEAEWVVARDDLVDLVVNRAGDDSRGPGGVGDD